MFDFKKYNDYELLYLYNIHSEEALRILLKKYSCLIDIKLCAFRVRNYQFADFRQECLLSLMYAINNYSETYNKTFYRYAELIIDRKIMRLLRNETYYNDHLVYLEDFDGFVSGEDVEKTGIYRKMIKEITEVRVLGIKEEILKEVFLKGVSIEDFSYKNNLERKDVYNQIYLLRNILKKKVL
jgi:DNA-directed RNA polymerase specialized sigma subunit